MFWQTARRKISLERPLVMGILNVTPDSFSDAGEFLSVDKGLRRVERILSEGADIIDIGGESTRPGSEPVSAEEEIARTVPMIEAVIGRFDTPVSIDTSKSPVARRALEAGAEIVNDISGLRFDPEIADVAVALHSGLILMHSRGKFGSMHSQPPVNDIFVELRESLGSSIAAALERGVTNAQVVLDVGVGFGKTAEQNLDLLRKLDSIVAEFAPFPIAVGASRKSFIAKVTGDAPVRERLGGSIAAAVIAVQKGASIVRVHDVAASVQALRLSSAIHP